MPGGRKTHDYPQGKPLPILFTEIAAVIAVLFWVVSYSWGWVFFLAASAGLIFVSVVLFKLKMVYESRALAVPIPKRPMAIRSPAGTPAPLIALRYAVVVMVFVMLGIGISPMPLARAKIGIIGCVLGLFTLSIFYFVLVLHYVKNGRASQD